MDVRALLRESLGSRVLILGGGITGQALGRFLLRAGYGVTFADEREICLGAECRNAELLAPAATCTLEAIRSRRCSFALTSPGISPRGGLVQIVRELNLPLFSEFDITSAYLGRPLVAVTGSNGKSTTTSLINTLLTASGVPSEPCGNIGRPLIELVDPAWVARAEEHPHPALVVEVSSYQLEWTSSFAPRVGVWLNLSENHLERHGSMDEYLHAKAKLFAQQTRGDWAVLCADDPHFASMKEHVCSRHCPYGTAVSGPDNALFLEHENVVRITLAGESEEYSLAELRLFGRHNKLNATAAIAAARLAGASRGSVQGAIESFAPLEHRLEIVPSADGIIYINDSKATTPAATAADLEAVRESFPSRRIVLLLGGQSKQGSWDEVRKQLSGAVAIGFGGDGGVVLKAIGVGGQAEPDLQTAVTHAIALAKTGDVILLAPGCASFDAYSGFEERGRHFKALVSGR